MNWVPPLIWLQNYWRIMRNRWFVSHKWTDAISQCFSSESHEVSISLAAFSSRGWWWGHELHSAAVCQSHWWGQNDVTSCESVAVFYDAQMRFRSHFSVCCMSQLSSCHAVLSTQLADAMMFPITQFKERDLKGTRLQCIVGECLFFFIVYFIAHRMQIKCILKYYFNIVLIYSF